MIDYYGDGQLRSRRAGGSLPEHGVAEESNPGEGSSSITMGSSRTLGNTASGAGQARRGPSGDTGSQVGALRNLEYSAGGRSHRISSGPYTRA